MIGPFAEQVALLDTIPGIDRRAAEVIVAEIGVDMEQFPTAAHRVPAGPAGGATRLGGRTQAALAVAASTASARELQNPAVVLTGARAPITDRLRALPSARTLTLTGFATELLHLIAALAVVLFTGYALFLPTWMGTFADLAQVVFCAFAVDVSIAGLTALVTSRAQTLPLAAYRASALVVSSVGSTGDYWSSLGARRGCASGWVR